MNYKQFLLTFLIGLLLAHCNLATYSPSSATADSSTAAIPYQNIEI